MRNISMFCCVCVILVSSMIPSLLSSAFVIFALLSCVLSFLGLCVLHFGFCCHFFFALFFFSLSLYSSFFAFFFVFFVAVCDLVIDLSLPILMFDQL